MLNKLLATSFCTIISLSASASIHAENDFSCRVEVAVATPPVQFNDKVAFNVTSIDNLGPNNSTTLSGGDAPDTLPVACFYTYNISATIYSTSANSLLLSPIGECILKAGNVSFNNSYDSVAVVFPNNFICNQA